MRSLLFVACCLAGCATLALPAVGDASVYVAESSPLLTTAGNPDDYIVPPGGPLGGVVKITVNGNRLGSGALLNSGRHILTAAHVVTNTSGVVDAASIEVTFELPGETLSFTGIPGTSVTVHPDWDGDYLFGNDIAVIELPLDALSSTASIAQYGIYGGKDDVGQVVEKVGYGYSGNGATGTTDLTYRNHLKRSGLNQYDTTADIVLASLGYDYAPGACIVYDFDNGLPENDALGVLYNIEDLGLGMSEVMIARGDSGGPALLDGWIAGITSYRMSIQTVDPQTGQVIVRPDVDIYINSSFGEIGVDTRVSHHAEWLKEVVPGLAVVPEPTSLVIWALLGAFALTVGYRRQRVR